MQMQTVNVGRCIHARKVRASVSCSQPRHRASGDRIQVEPVPPVLDAFAREVVRRMNR